MGFLEWKMLLKWQNPLKTVFRDLNILVVISRIFTFEWKVWSLRKFLNSHWWVGDLVLFEVLAGETFGHLNYSLYQHNGELDTNSPKKSNAQGFSWREGDMGSFIIKEQDILHIWMTWKQGAKKPGRNDQLPLKVLPSQCNEQSQ